MDRQISFGAKLLLSVLGERAGRKPGAEGAGVESPGTGGGRRDADGRAGDGRGADGDPGHHEEQGDAEASP